MVKETQLQQGLAQLRTRLLVMCASTGLALENACRSLALNDLELAQSVVEGDAGIDFLENEIDEMALTLLARNQPFAQDLRFVVAAFRMVADLERIGDEAVSIAERGIVLRGKIPDELTEVVAPLIAMARQLYQNAVEAFQAEDAQRALALSKSDDENQQAEVQALHGIMNLLCQPGKRSQNLDYSVVMHGILISHSLYRVCRRSANLAEQTYFILRGINLRHGMEKPE